MNLPLSRCSGALWRRRGVTRILRRGAEHGLGVTAAAGTMAGREDLKTSNLGTHGLEDEGSGRRGHGRCYKGS